MSFVFYYLLPDCPLVCVIVLFIKNYSYTFAIYYEFYYKHIDHDIKQEPEATHRVHAGF